MGEVLDGLDQNSGVAADQSGAGDRRSLRPRLADIGSGAGVPGLVVANALAGVPVTLIERREGRATWLEEAAAGLSGEDVVAVVRCADVYDVARGPDRAAFDVVTARAFGSPASTAELGGALLRVGGVLVISEPPNERASRWSSVDLTTLGLTAIGPVEQAGVRFQLLVRREPLASRFPRRRAGAG